MLGTNCGYRQGSGQEDRQDMLDCPESHHLLETYQEGYCSQTSSKSV